MDESYLQAMVYAMPDPVACVDGGGRVVCWNKGAAALFLVDEEHALGRALQEVIKSKAALKDGARVVAARSDGRAFEVIVAVSPAGGHGIVVFAHGDAPRDPRDELSPRLLEVLELLLEGHGEKQIAGRLALSPHTVHDYVKALYKKYGVASRAELLALVLPGRRASASGSG